MMRDQTTTDEIAQIERELDILRSRQASLARWYRITMIYLAITFPVIAGLTLAIIYTWNIDIVVGASIVGMAVIVAGLIWVIGPPSSVPPDQQQPSQFLPIGLGRFRPSGPNYKSDAETIHDMIVLRKQRLAELKGEPPPLSAVSFRLRRNLKNQAETVRTVIGLRIETTT
ncbi:MAG: hypothetical protein ACJ8FA_04305 [Xanthobacteraceae bacterium]